MKLSIIVPIYNEERTITTVVDRMLAIKFPIPIEILLVNDGSTDNTLRKLKKYKRHKRIKLISYQKNQGKGYALRQGFKNASGNILTIQDADLEYHPKTIPDLLKPILKNKTSVVYGNRFSKKGNPNFAIPSHFIGNKILNHLFNLLFSSSLSDIETCYKVFKKQALGGLPFTQDRFGIEVELTARFIKNGCTILEIPIKYNARKKTEGKKITWWDGVEAAGLICKYRWKNGK